jgi:hypothetical protein
VFALLLASVAWSQSCDPFESLRIEVALYEFESADLPTAFDGVRVAFVSDIHHGPFYSQGQVGRLVDLVNGLGADLVLLGGDYVYAGTKYESTCFAELARLSAPLGRYAVLGNHDYGRPDSADPGPGKAIAAAAEAGIPLLRNQGVWLQKDGQRIRLGGVADYKASTSDLDPVVEGTSESDFVLLISHHPDFSEDLPEGAVDLVLAGHTHGGQFTVFGVWAPRVPSAYGQKYRTGRVDNEVTTVIVSNGVGTSTPLPVRVYAPAQVVVVTLRSAAATSVGP